MRVKLRTAAALSYDPAMLNEIRIVLSLDALEHLTQGHELVFDDHATALRLVLCADDDTVNSFQRHVQLALLHMLPVGTTRH